MRTQADALLHDRLPPRPLRNAPTVRSPVGNPLLHGSPDCRISVIWLSFDRAKFFLSGGRTRAGGFLRELTTRELRALAAVHKHRSVTAAAKQLHLTQPAVTLQLRNLQALAGLPLIQRSNDGMLLTDAGREVLALSERIEAAI